MGAEGFISPRNDRVLALGYVALMIIFFLAFLAAFYGTYSGTLDTYQPYFGGEEEDGTPEEPGWTPATVQPLSVSGETQEGQASQESFVLDQSRVLEVEIALSWSDDVGSNDRFRLSLLREGTVLRSGESDTGTINLRLADEEGGLAGNYTAVIEALDCPGAVPGSPIDRDSGNTWQLDVSARVETLQQQTPAEASAAHGAGTGVGSS